MGSLLENRPPRTYPPPEYMLQQESHKGRLETSGKMAARNPADKVHYIVRFVTALHGLPIYSNF